MKADKFVIIDSEELETGVDEVQRISGYQLAGDPKQAIADAVEMFKHINISHYMLRELDTFEEMMIALYIIKFQMVRQKQKDYGPNAIQLGDELDIISRIKHKSERAKNLLGDPAEQVKKARTLLETLPDDINADEAFTAISQLDDIFFPRNSVENESVEDTAIDTGNYGDILFLLLLKVWGKPMDDEG